jgi:hypothetical protein
MAEVVIPRNLFDNVLRAIAELGPGLMHRQHRAFGCHALKQNSPAHAETIDAPAPADWALSRETGLIGVYRRKAFVYGRTSQPSAFGSI